MLVDSDIGGTGVVVSDAGGTDVVVSGTSEII